MPEIAFVLEKPDSDLCAFCLRLIEVEKEDGKIKFLPTHRHLYKETLKKLATSKDKEFLSLLVQEEMRFQGLSGLRISSDTLPFNKIHISASQVEKILKDLAATGKCFFNQKQVLIDFFTPVEFFCSICAEEGQIKVFGKYLWNEKEYDLHSADLFFQGPPYGILKDRVLRFLTTEAKQPPEWKWLKPFQTVVHLNYPLHQKNEWLDRYNQQDFRLFVQSEELLEKEKPAEVFPILVLKDRTGGFANLLLDYGHGSKIDYHSQSKTNFTRQKQIEKEWEDDLLQTDFIRKTVGTTHYYCPLNKVAKSLTFLLECGWTILDNQGKKLQRFTNTDLSLAEAEHNLIIKGRARYENYEVNISDVVGAFNRKEVFISLADNAFGLLPDSLKDSALMEGEVVSQGIKYKKNRFGSLHELFDHSEVRCDDTFALLKRSADNFTGIQEMVVPLCFKAELRSYQQAGVNWLAFLKKEGLHGILADDMGLGKTVQTIAFLTTLKPERPHLIVVPTTLLFHWRKEIERFWPTAKIYLHHGKERFKNKDLWDSTSVVITSYGTLRQDSEFFKKIDFDCVILDEAQAIKNPQSQIAQAAFSLNASFRLSMTGTPVENSLQDLWSQFHFLMPDLLGTAQVFQSEVIASSSDARYLQRIKRRIAPFLLRRTKDQVAKDLPEKIEQIVWIEMSEQQRSFYESFLASLRSGILKKVELDGMNAHRMEVFESILRLRQICCSCALVSHLVDQSLLSSSKLEMLLEEVAILMEEGKKVLIYSQFTSMLQLMAQAFQEKNWNYLYLDGSTKNREAIVKSFQEDASFPLFLISLKAGGVGLNLTAADAVIIFDPWWNDAVENQAIDRAHRIGRKDSVIAKRYIALESIEEKMLKLKQNKNQIAEGLLVDGEKSLSLTEEDLKFLLS